MFEVLIVITRYHNEAVMSRREINTYRYKSRRTAVKKFGQIAEVIKNDSYRVRQVKGNPCKYVISGVKICCRIKPHRTQQPPRSLR